MPVRIGDDAAKALPPYYSHPGQLRQEYFVDAALQIATVPAAELRQRRPPVPIVMNPPRYGFRRTPLTIEDVIATDRWAPRRRQWLSGAPGLPERRNDPVDGAEGGLRDFITQGFV